LSLHSLEVNAKDNFLMTPLHRACALGQLEAAETLRDLGADFAALDSFGRTPFVVAWQYGQEALMKLCRDSGSNREADSARSIDAEDLPIWSLVRSGRLDLLAEAKNRREAEFSCKEPGTGKTNFHTAILNNDDETACMILEMLLNSSAKNLLDATDDDKQTPLHLASIQAHAKCIELLVKHEVKLDEVDRFGKTAIYSAFVNEDYGIAVYLVEAGTTISEDCGVDLQKMLFVAIEFESVEAVRRLLEAGADVIGQDEYGVTPKEFAKNIGNDEISHLLLTSKSAYFKEVPSRKATGMEVSTVEVEESPSDELPAMPLVPMNLGAVPFHPFRARAVHLDWSSVKEIEEQEEIRDPVPVLA
jgi:ankyrin repeat protein